MGGLLRVVLQSLGGKVDDNPSPSSQADHRQGLRRLMRQQPSQNTNRLANPATKPSPLGPGQHGSSEKRLEEGARMNAKDSREKERERSEEPMRRKAEAQKPKPARHVVGKWRKILDSSVGQRILQQKKSIRLAEAELANKPALAAQWEEMKGIMRYMLAADPLTTVSLLGSGHSQTCGQGGTAQLRHQGGLHLQPQKISGLLCGIHCQGRGTKRNGPAPHTHTHTHTEQPADLLWLHIPAPSKPGGHPAIMTTYNREAEEDIKALQHQIRALWRQREEDTDKFAGNVLPTPAPKSEEGDTSVMQRSEIAEHHLRRKKPKAGSISSHDSYERSLRSGVSQRREGVPHDVTKLHQSPVLKAAPRTNALFESSDAL
ncbi:hypothetical protein CYMTET_42403 [Cymbomonas tetramitiformis]|uniref:Uncharacterized protein n=1 Tax=Cymbomonas tetramitiformis TaxID=36881 RepID=A0AAE0F1J9_9CHLO|nr:hypothetical protein CYMTET_42403 [Cymbomonas tetramitiformis]